MSVTGEGPGRPPMKCGPPVTDITAGILAAMGVLAAYAHRLRTGQGQAVDTSLFEAGITHTYWQSAIAMATGIAPGPMGSAHPLNAPYEAFETADGWITIGAANQTNWLRLLKAIGAEALGRGSPLRAEPGPHGQPARTRRDPGPGLPRATVRRSGWRAWRPAVCRPARCSTSTPCTGTRRRWPARWWSRSIIPASAG